MDQIIEIVLYAKPNGKEPFIEWLESLKDKQTQRIILDRLYRIRSGNCGDTKSVGNGVCEMRIHIGKGYRVYFGRIGNTIVVVLCGGEKDTQIYDIQKAKEYWENYKEVSHATHANTR